MRRGKKADGLTNNPDLLIVHRVVAYGLAYTDVFRSWSDNEKRYLLDRALEKEILLSLLELGREEAKSVYFSQSSAKTIAFYESNITQCKSLQEKLRERVSPADPQMRK